jgi:hypothetical protein
VLVDLDRAQTVRAALDGVDLVVNAVPDRLLRAERLVLERGLALVNLSAVPAALGGALQHETTNATGTVLIPAGLVPGVASLVAADLLQTHPEAEELEVAFAISARGTSGKGGASLVHSYLIAARHHQTFRVELGPSFGARTCFEGGVEERAWLAEGVLGQRTVHLGIYLQERPLEALFRGLNTLRLMSTVPRWTFVAGKDRVPAEATREPIAEWVAVKRGGKRLAARTIEGLGDYRMTAASAVVFGEALLEQRASQYPRTGVFAPEELFTLGQLLGALETHGFRIVER